MSDVRARGAVSDGACARVGAADLNLSADDTVDPCPDPVTARHGVAFD